MNLLLLLGSGFVQLERINLAVSQNEPWKIKQTKARSREGERGGVLLQTFSQRTSCEFNEESEVTQNTTSRRSPAIRFDLKN